MLGFRIFGRALRNIWEEMLPLGAMSAITFVAIALAPILALAILLAPLPPELFILVIPLALPGPPAWMALHVVANRVANAYAIRLDQYFGAFKANLRALWLYTVIASLVSALLLYNIFFYPNAFPNDQWAMWVAGAWLAAGVFWMALQLFVIPFFVEQESKRWRTALRNAVLIAGANPFMTLILLALTVVLLVASALLAPPLLVVFGPILWVMMGTTAVVDRVTSYRKSQEKDGESEEDKTPERIMDKWRNRGPQ